LPKRLLAELRIDGSEIGVIEDVECFRSELELQILMNREFTPDGQVHLHGIEAPREVSGSIAEAGTYLRESLWIDCPAPWTSLPRKKIIQTLKNSGTIRAVQIDRLPRNKV